MVAPQRSLEDLSPTPVTRLIAAVEGIGDEVRHLHEPRRPGIDEERRFTQGVEPTLVLPRATIARSCKLHPCLQSLLVLPTIRDQDPIVRVARFPTRPESLIERVEEFPICGFEGGLREAAVYHDHVYPRFGRTPSVTPGARDRKQSLGQGVALRDRYRLPLALAPPERTSVNLGCSLGAGEEVPDRAVDLSSEGPNRVFVDGYASDDEGVVGRVCNVPRLVRVQQVHGAKNTAGEALKASRTLKRPSRPLSRAYPSGSCSV